MTNPLKQEEKSKCCGAEKVPYKVLGVTIDSCESCLQPFEPQQEECCENGDLDEKHDCLKHPKEKAEWREGIIKLIEDIFIDFPSERAKTKVLDFISSTIKHHDEEIIKEIKIYKENKLAVTFEGVSLIDDIINIIKSNYDKSN